VSQRLAGPGQASRGLGPGLVAVIQAGNTGFDGLQEPRPAVSFPLELAALFAGGAGSPTGAGDRHRCSRRRLRLPGGGTGGSSVTHSTKR
jgi:hypothetical protein